MLIVNYLLPGEPMKEMDNSSYEIFKSFVSNLRDKIKSLDTNVSAPLPLLEMLLILTIISYKSI